MEKTDCVSNPEIFRDLMPAGQVRAILRRRLPQYLFEDTIEVRQRLETDFKRDFTDTQVWIEQQVLRFFDPRSRDVVSEVYSGDLLKDLAEIKRAGVNRFGDLAKGKLLGLVFVDEFPGAGNDARFGVFSLDNNLVAQH